MSQLLDSIAIRLGRSVLYCESWLTAGKRSCAPFINLLEWFLKCLINSLSCLKAGRFTLETLVRARKPWSITSSDAGPKSARLKRIPRNGCSISWPPSQARGLSLTGQKRGKHQKREEQFWALSQHWGEAYKYYPNKRYCEGRVFRLGISPIIPRHHPNLTPRLAVPCLSLVEGPGYIHHCKRHGSISLL